MRKLKFEDIPSAIEEVLEKLDHLEKEIVSIKKEIQPKDPVELLTRKETAEFFNISLPTLYHWSKTGVLKSYRMGNRVYYKRSEIENRLMKLH